MKNIQLRYAAIVESSEDAIISKSLDGIIESWNASAERIFGYSEAEAVGQPITILIPPELLDEEKKILERVRAGLRIKQYETVRVTKAGTKVDVSLSISPMKNSAGRIVGVSKIARDITERKRAERELLQTNERLNLFVEAGRIGEWEANIKNGRSFWFGQTHAMLGIDPEVHSASTEEFWNRVHPEDRGWLKDALQEAIRDHSEFAREFRVVWPDGSVHWLRSQGRFFYGADGQAERMLGISVDITDRKRAEKALLEMNRTLEAQGALLRSRQELLSVFVKNVPAAVAMLDRDMRYLQVSDRWCSDYLPGRAQVLGRSHYEIFPDMPERWKEIHRRALQGETLRADEDRWDGRDGTHWARWEVRPWKTPEGTVGGILILAEEITQRKQMEEAISAMTRKLVEAQEQERTRIARELHDDINQRLAMLAIELSQLQNNNDLTSEVRGRMQELQQTTSDISRGIHDLSHELHFSTLDYLGLVTGMRSWCEEYGLRQKLEINFKSNDVPTLPQETSLCLFRVLQEALHNAAKYSGAHHIDVQLTKSLDAIHLIVRDSGGGFDIETARQKRGLGLTSMQERVRLIGGTIVIDSKPMVGTTIDVRVPFTAESAQGAAC